VKISFIFQKLFSGFIFAFGWLASNVSPVLAQDDGVVDPVPRTATPFPDLAQLIANVIAIVIFLAALLVFIFLLIGGLQWILSGGDKAAAQAARDRITSALVGLVIIVAAFALMLIIERVFGVSVLSGFTPPTAPNTVGRPG
jgi:cbb3-type cytochrome oxidase subunit 3